MADNVAITAGTGTTIATDERTVGGSTVQIQRVDEIGGSTLANGQAAPTGTAATLVAARDTRKRLLLVNRGSQSVYVGIATVTTANGLEMKPGDSLELRTTALVQGITASGTGRVDYIEEYD